MGRKDLAQRALRQRGKAFVPHPRAVLANVPRKQPRRPQFVGIAEVLGLAAGEVDNERPRFVGDDRLAARTRTVVERRHGAQSFRTPHAALDRLMRHPDRLPHRVKRRGLSVGEQHARPLDPARRRRSRTRNPRQFRNPLIRKSQLNYPTGSRHVQTASFHESLNDGLKPLAQSRESLAYGRLQGIDVLER